MRKPRILGFRKANVYHVMSRVVDGRFIFETEEKEFFLQTLRRLESFTGLRVLTYCIMSNHWHILVEVPSPEPLDDDALLERIRNFYPKPRAAAIAQEFAHAQQSALETGSDRWLNELRSRYLSRRGNLSAFVKELKEHFSKWYNRRHHRRGTLWEERFKSVLIENSTHTLSTMAAYIDLNPVRGGLVDDPVHYRFCGYAEAVAGGAAAREGIRHIQQSEGLDASWRQVIDGYRQRLFRKAAASSIKPATIDPVLHDGSGMSPQELLRCRIRYFSDGVAVGDRAFIEEVFTQNRQLFGERRKSGARRMRGEFGAALFSLRDLTYPIAASG